MKKRIFSICIMSSFIFLNSCGNNQNEPSDDLNTEELKDLEKNIENKIDDLEKSFDELDLLTDSVNNSFENNK